MTFSKIKEILNRELVEDINQEEGIAILKETNPNAKLQKVQLRGLHKDSIVFKLDVEKKDFKKKSPYLSDGKGLHKGCDYVIITRYGEENIVLLCELKSGDISGAKEQLRSSIPFLDYMASLLYIHEGIDFTAGAFKRYFLLLSTKRLNKRSIKPGYSFSTEKFKGIPIKHGKDITFIQLDKIIRS